MNERFEIACPGCARTLRLTVAALARRPECTYCGATLAVPAGVAARVEALVASRPEAGRPVRVRMTCLVCGRADPVAGDAIGQVRGCRYCGAGQVVPPADGPGVDPPPPADLPVLFFPCPACREALALPGACGAGPVTCPACGRESDLRAADPAAAFGLSAGDGLVAQLADRVLRSRWAAATIALAEIESVYRSLDRLAGWDPAAGREVSPLAPDPSILVAHRLVLGMPGALRTDATTGLTYYRVHRGERTGGSITPDLDAAMILNSLGLGLAVTVGTGLWVAPGEGDEAPDAPSTVFAYQATGRGTLLASVYVDAHGGIEPVAPDRFEGFAVTIRTAMVAFARAYLAFRAIFGSWAGPEQMAVASPEAMVGRLAAVLPTAAARAGDLVGLLLDPTSDRGSGVLCWCGRIEAGRGGTCSGCGASRPA